MILERERDPSAPYTKAPRLTQLLAPGTPITTTRLRGITSILLKIGFLAQVQAGSPDIRLPRHAPA